MAGYPKIWTTIESEDWWQRLSLDRRGAVCQFLLWCKKDGDTGHLEFRSWRFLAERLGCHHQTCRKVVTDLSQKPSEDPQKQGSNSLNRNKCAADLSRVNFLQLEERVDGSLHIFVPKYKKWQQIKTSAEALNLNAGLDKCAAELSAKPNLSKAKQSKEREGEREGERERKIPYLKVLKIQQSIFAELKAEFPGINHDDELKKADLYRLDKPGKGKKPNDHLFLRNWFKNALKFKEDREPEIKCIND